MKLQTLANLGELAASSWWCPDFQKIGDEMIRNDRFDAKAIERWRRFVAGEGLPSETAAREDGSG